MRTIETTKQYEKDLKREAKGQHGPTLSTDLRTVIEVLAVDEALSAKYRDHKMTGQFKELRNCHVKPDLVLLYEKPRTPKNVLLLIRLGSHSELGIA